MNSIQNAIQEIAAANDERRLGPKDCARCPDCLAVLRVETDESGRVTLEHVAHADSAKSQKKNQWSS